ncbi:MAG: excinuclease ABC subunit UvrC [Clostridia bacterium]|jgi:excinuclease ABC, C subunit|nr:excinuclease ABC subunit UvrC [Clostridia bacterium]
MHDKNDKIIYVGKAVSLKNRVRQYFRKTNKTKRIENMVALIDHFEYIVTDNEAEALILECNLIKKNMPKFNVLLKDDKTYPYIKVNIKADYPDVYITRRILNDGAKYFGPYANAGSAKEMVDFIKTKFKIRQCKTFKYKDRPCLNYHIKKCLAPCMGYISKEEYMEQINQIIDLLEGKTDKIIRQLKKEMEEASIKFEYEKAAYIRDKILAIDNISKRQKVSNLSENDIDVIGIAKSKYQVCLEMFFIRNSKMIGRKHYFLANIQDEEDSEILSSFIKQYYVGNPILPHKIMIKENIEDKEIIEKSLTEQAGRKVEIKAPQKGEKLRLVEMAENNAKITLENKEKDKTTILTELKEALSLENIPRKIECFDISNISGTNVVAGMCVMQDGVIKKNLSRRFKIKTVIGQDDPACMREVVTRRLKHSIENSEGGFGKLPDVIFADGGITQIRAIKQAISDVQKWINSELSGSVKLNIAVFGMVKDDTHSTRALIDEERNEIQISEKLMNLITNFQDQVHETAISYHRKLRDKQITKSELDEIKGIGETKKRELLKYFGSINKIREANIEEIAKIKGINLELAKTIKNKLK